MEYKLEEQEKKQIIELVNLRQMTINELVKLQYTMRNIDKDLTEIDNKFYNKLEIQRESYDLVYDKNLESVSGKKKE